MSWGERSCKNFGKCDKNPTMLDCNVNCTGYEWDGQTKPDSKPARVDYMKVTYRRKK